MVCSKPSNVCGQVAHEIKAPCKSKCALNSACGEKVETAGGEELVESKAKQSLVDIGSSRFDINFPFLLISCSLDMLCYCCATILVQQLPAIPKDEIVVSKSELDGKIGTANGYVACYIAYILEVLKRCASPSTTIHELARILKRCCQRLRSICPANDCCFVSVPQGVASSVINNGEIDLKLDSALPPDPPCFNKPTSQLQVTDSTTRLTLEVSGMDCADCAIKVTRAVERLANVDLLDFSYFTGRATVTHDPEITTARSIANFVARATGFAVNPLIQEDTNDSTTHNSLPLKFSKSIPQDVLSRFDVRSKAEAGGYIEVFFMAKGAAGRSSREVMAELAAYGPTLVDADLIQKAQDRVTQDFKSVGLRTIAIIILAIPVLILAWAPLPRNPIAYGAASVGLTTLIQGLAMPIVMSSVRSILFLHQADMAVLITVSTLTAYIFSLVAFGLEVAGTPFAEPFFETTALLIPLIYLGRFIQASCRKSAKSTVAALQQLQSKEVVLVVGDGSSAIEQPLDIR